MSRKERYCRFFATFLCLCMLFTMPGIQNVFPVVAAAGQEESFQKENIITKFYPLSEDVKEQTVFTGTDLDELDLPKELIVCLARDSFTQKEGESEQESKEHENTGETDNIEKNVGIETEDEQDILSDGNVSEKTDVEDEGNEGGSVPSEEQEESDSMLPSEELEESEIAQETYTVTLPEYHAQSITLVQTLDDTQTEKQEETVTIDGVTWQSKPEYDGNTEGTYTFTAVLPEGYALAEGVSLPQITVTVEVESGIDVIIQTLLDRIAALPDVEEYLASEPDMEDEGAYAEWEEKLYAYAEEALAIWEEYEALTEEQQTQITEEELTKLTAWVELAEQFSDHAVMLADDSEHHGESGWQALTVSNTELSGGNYYLASDIEIDDTITITGNVTLCLNGQTLKHLGDTGSVIRVKQGVTFTLCDCSGNDRGCITGGKGDSSLTEGNTVCGGGIGLEKEAHFIMLGGTIFGNGADNGGGIYIGESAIFEMNGGCIINNTVGKGYDNPTVFGIGGAIFAQVSSNVSITNGIICENKSNCEAGGIYLSQSAKLILKTRNETDIISITGNIAYDGGGGLYALYSSSTELAGNVTINGNKDENGNPDNIHLKNRTLITVTDRLTGSFGVSTQWLPYNDKTDANKPFITIVQSGNGYKILEEDFARFSSDNKAYSVLMIEDKDGRGKVLVLGNENTGNLSGMDLSITDGSSGEEINLNFAETTYEYRVTVPNSVKAVGIKATPKNSDAVVAMTIQNADKTTDTTVQADSIPLAEGENTIKVNVTEGDASKVYIITIKREEAPAGNPVTITTNRDSLPWKENLPTYKLTSDNGTSFVTDLTAVPDGTYDIYYDYGSDKNIDTGVEVKVEGAAATAIVNYYTVTFYDGDDELPTSTQQIVPAGATASAPTDNPTKTGYTFSKWVTTDGGSTAYDFTQAVNAKTLVYASWSANTYTVLYDGNDSTGGSTANSTHTYGTAKDLTANGFTRSCKVTFNLNYTGSSSTDKTVAYTFAGWNAKADGSGTPYADQASVENLTETNNGTVTLYAQWTPTSVTYTPTRAGYTFAGWYTDASCSDSRADSNGTYTANGNMTLYAKWAPESYHVTLNTNEGTGGTSLTSYTCGTVTTLPTDWTKTGYTFAGWYDNEDYRGNPVTEISATDTGDKTFWAKWTPQTYQVTFHYHGADGGDTTTSKNVTYDSTYGKLPAPTRTGYTFKGWYTEESGQGSKVEETTVVKTASAHTLHAYWKDETPPDKPVLNGVTLPTGWTNTWGKIPLKLYDGVGVTSLLVSVDGSPYTEVSGFSSGTGSMTHDYTPVQEGEHKYQFKAVDAAGNFAESDIFPIKLDQTKPVIGTLTYDNAVHTNLWHWIIGKESIVIHVPVTDTGSGVTEISYTRTDKDAEGNLNTGSAVTDTATVTNGEAKITIAADFRGTIAISCKDAAGNAADGVTIGKSAGGMIVEDNAPDITVLADRNTFDTQPTQPSGVNVSEEYYNSAPALIVTVKDDTGSAITAGIATVTYQVEGAAEKSVTVDTSVLQEEVTFTIPADEIPTGITKITIKATDNAGNPADRDITINVKGPEKQPAAVIDYRQEELTGLVPGGSYTIDGTAYTADGEGRIPIKDGKDDGWFGTTVNIVKKGNGSETSDSPAQSLSVPARPAAPDTPELSTRDDKSITLKTLPNAPQYRRTDGTGNWQDSTVFTGLDQKTIYRFRAYYPATDTSFASRESGEAQIATMPTAPTPDKLKIGYVEETLTFTDGIEAFTDQSCTTPVTAGSVTAYMGQTIYIRYPANDIIPASLTTAVSIPARPAKPTPGKEDASYPKATDGAITGLTPGTTYEYRVKDTDGNFGAWKAVTPGGTKIENLPAGDYEVRVKAVETGNASFQSEAAAVTIGEKPGVKVTFMVDGRVYATRFTGNGGNLTDIPPVPTKDNAIGAWCMDEQGKTPAVFTNITADMTVYAVYTTAYTVTLQTGTGYTLSAQGDSESPVKEGGSFTFRFALANGYQQNADFAVKVNGVKVELTAQEPYTYTITDIRENKTVTVEGVVKKPGGKPSDGGDKEDDPKPEPDDPSPKPDDQTPKNPAPKPPVTPPSKPTSPAPTPGETPPAGKQPEGRPGTTPKREENGAQSESGEPEKERKPAQQAEVKIGDGTVIVTVVCEEEKCTATVADTEKVVKAVLTPDQQELVNGGETIEIRIDVTDISEKVPARDKEVIESGIEAYREEVPGLVLGMYVDISMFIKIGAGDWNAITETDEPIEVVVNIPEKLLSDNRKFIIIRAHNGEYTFMDDMDDAPDTITVSTDLFSSYAIAYVGTDSTDTDAKCGLCHICPTFLGICYFIWLAVIIALVLIICIIWRKKRQKEEKKAD